MKEQSNAEYIYRGTICHRGKGECSVNVNTSVTFIKDRTFYNWTKFWFIKILSTVTIIGDRVFFTTIRSIGWVMSYAGRIIDALIGWIDSERMIIIRRC